MLDRTRFAMNRNCASRSGGCADDLEAAVELESVGIDDLAVELCGDFESERGFAGSGGATDDKDTGGL